MPALDHAPLPPDTIAIVVGAHTIGTPFGAVDTPAQLLALLDGRAGRRATLRVLPGTDYDAIGRVIYTLVRARVTLDGVDMPEPPAPGAAPAPSMPRTL